MKLEERSVLIKIKYWGLHQQQLLEGSIEYARIRKMAPDRFSHFCDVCNTFPRNCNRNRREILGVNEP